MNLSPLLLLLLISLNMMDEEPSKTKVIAHRGAWKNTNVPENSIAALQHAIALKCYGSEFDVHLSADSVLFVLHDHTIQGIPIEKTTAAELSKVKLSNGESLPTLESYLLAGKNQTQTRLILEIKTSQLGKARSLALTKKCIDLVSKTGVATITDYIAFDFDVCLQVKKLAPTAQVQYLNGDKTPEQLATAGLDGFDYHFSVLKRNEHWLSDAHARHLSTNAWTVNEEETMRWLINRKINMITTNEPEQLLKILNQQ
ncbi:MAG: glycerophosphodiester phosphodiesterase [Cyclobacteriaceae bacterium]|nr:glycerophosphodiester phosphodiesterase [Cyclobacteriaceae bacterium]